jgi:lipid A 3-O-deacylase
MVDWDFERLRPGLATAHGIVAAEAESVTPMRFLLRPMSSKMRILVFLSIVLVANLPALAQSRPEDGGRELQVWSGGGHSVAGGTPHTTVWNMGLRYGWVLTRPHGPGILKGRFEYVLDATPLFVIWQKYNTAFGGGFSPLGLKWDFASRGPVEPYLELNGGTLFTNQSVPTGTSAVNFTSAAAFGVHLFGEKYAWSVEARYMHISNAGLATPNPGINTVQVRVGVGKFWHQ